MFKAKLIDNTSYYKLRGKQFLLIILPSIPLGMLVNFYQMPVWLIVVLAGLYIFFEVKMFKNSKLMQSMLGNKLINMDTDKIMITSGKGEALETIHLDSQNKITLKKEYGLAQESFSDMKNEFRGNPKMNFIIVENQGKSLKFDFEIDSYYMLKQLEKIIEAWKSSGYKIEKI